LSYGGLRGAISLSLGLLILLDERFNKKFRDLCLFYVLAVIVSTVCFNGLTIKFLIQLTGFLDEEQIKKNIKKNMTCLLFDQTEKRMKELSEMNEFAGVQWDNVGKLTKLTKFKEA